jgi:hypothetical protein
MKLPVALLAALLAGCAALAPLPRPGQTEADANRRFGTPTARYALLNGGTRLEYVTGPMGRETWMVDLDAQGRVTSADQVLDPGALATFQGRAPGLTSSQVLRLIGTPGERRRGGWAGGEVWSWRYPNNDCQWFQVSIGDDDRVTGATFGIDPTCDAPSDARS